MSVRELVVLGTASQVPTRYRNHNGYLLRWDGYGVLFDPGEGTQRQMTAAGVTSHDVNRICITHAHGDHCLGLAGVLQRISLDGVPHPVDVCFPASAAPYVRRLRYASVYVETADVREVPCAPGVVSDQGSLRLVAARLDHSPDTLGWRLEEPPGRRMLADRLAKAGIEGPAVGELQRRGEVHVGGRVAAVEEFSEERRGQRFAFVMDTRLCDAAFELADGVDLLVCESTFLDSEAALGEQAGHLTARQAGRIAREAGVRRLVLAHFSQRHPDADAYVNEAREEFDDVVAARDLERIPLPPRA